MATAKTSGTGRSRNSGDVIGATAPAADDKAADKAAGKAGDPDASPQAVEAAPRPRLRKKELIARVAGLSGVKKTAVRPIVEATLAALGDALAAGDELVLPPFGKLRVNRQRDLPTGAVMTLRLRRRAVVPVTEPVTDTRPDPAEADDEPLAKAGEQS